MSLIEPKIDDLLGQVDSKYTLVILAAKRARQINSYYTQLGEGIGEFVAPLVSSVDPGRKPLSIALEEISQSKLFSGADSDFNSPVGRAQIVTGLRN